MRSIQKLKTPPKNPLRPWIQKVCVVCSEHFYIVPSRDKDRLNLTCSSECWRAQPPMVFKRLTVIPITCVHCGIECQADRKIQKFCSTACRNSHKSCELASTRERVGRKQRLGWPIGTVRERKNGGYKSVKIGLDVWVQEHRHVMEQALGRSLLRAEQVHHRNGVQSNNDLDNLMVVGDPLHREIHRQAERLGLRDMWVHPIEGMEL